VLLNRGDPSVVQPSQARVSLLPGVIVALFIMSSIYRLSGAA
jgi:hypothetical protein